MRIWCASANPHKVDEIARLMPRGIEMQPRPAEVGDIDEDAPSLEGNAVLKAVEIANHVHGWAIADDTGLEVASLGGEPGVRSARFAGEPSNDAANRALLLERLQGVSDRSAVFRTVVALVNDKGEMHFLRGECRGVITEAERGSNGFGYDAVFVPDDGDGRTFAEMTPAEKDAVSHRSHALAQLPDLIDRLTGRA